jgi:hypothetical protein
LNLHLFLYYYSPGEALPDPWKWGVGIEDSSLVVESSEDIRLWEEGVERPDLLGAPAATRNTLFIFHHKYISWCVTLKASLPQKYLHW